jgi:glycerophosphoryl diester phosphodiesterase
MDDGMGSGVGMGPPERVFSGRTVSTPRGFAQQNVDRPPALAGREGAGDARARMMRSSLLRRSGLSSSIALAFALALAACGGTGPVTPIDEGSGGGGGAGGGAPKPVVDPSLFDCTAKKPPVRVDATPVACATDPLCKTRLVSAHRGAGGQLGVVAPEDTVAAVRAAIVMGVDYIETDPRPTKDGVLVNLHDASVDRTTLGKGDAASMTLAEIQALPLRADAFAGDYSCEHIPTLEEILTAARGKVHVLVDANKTDRVDLLVQAIQKTDTLAWAIFDTDSVDKIDEALALEPKLFTMIRVADEAELADELAHFAAHPPVVVELHDGADAAKLVPAIHDAKNRAFTDVFATDVAVNFDHDLSHYEEAWSQGLDVLQTDRPDLVLMQLGKWPPPPQP